MTDQPGEVTGQGASTVGAGRLKRMARYDGYEAVYTYSQYGNTVTTPYAGDVAGKLTTTTWDPGSQSETVTVTVGGQVLQKTVTARTATSSTQTVYTSAGSTLTTVTNYVPASQDFGGRPTKILHPDNTLTTYSYTRNAGGGYTTISEHGSKV